MSTGPGRDEGAKRSRTATRRRLLETAAGVFAERGIEGASVGELCAAAGFSRGAFYSNFGSKTDLALAMYEDHVEQLVSRLGEQLERWLTAGASAEEVVVRILEGLSDHTSDTTWHTVRLELLLTARRSPAVREVLVGHRDALVDAVVDALTRVARRQRLRFTVEVADLARMLLATYDGALNARLADGPEGAAQHDVAPAIWLAFTRPEEADGTPPAGHR
ncbi:TetR/AcrR family transcriptional regulator [Kocuria turfanensis]|uniref:TetR family transcriptional regulator n=1 Tax=Kocuria turfanensis TaxID=388357 RepID=A0A512IEC6_9MICC|nr:TetR/AcrR family transcriptional regulator [Kocuria turfanensis]GEO96054.1 TetR family transcriptional regulator [Kocuria turfanensis]